FDRYSPVTLNEVSFLPRFTKGGSCSGSAVGVPGSLSLDGDTHERSVLGPRPVVVLDVVVAEKLGEDEPRVRRALADAAVGDDRLVPTDARVRIELLELVGGAEGAVLGCRLAPRDVGRPGAVAGHLCLLLREMWRGEQVAAELL